RHARLGARRQGLRVHAAREQVQGPLLHDRLRFHRAPRRGRHVADLVRGPQDRPRRGEEDHRPREEGSLVAMADSVSAVGVTPDELVARADALRPRLLEEQAATEERGYYSEELHDAFREAGFYRIFVPRSYGGLELDVPTFYRVIASVSRGCPSTGWMLALG